MCAWLPPPNPRGAHPSFTRWPHSHRAAQVKDWFAAGQGLLRRQDKINNLPYFDFVALEQDRKDKVRGLGRSLTPTSKPPMLLS